MESNSTGALVLALLAKADKAGELLQKVLMDLEQEFVKNRNFEELDGFFWIYSKVGNKDKMNAISKILDPVGL